MGLSALTSIVRRMGTGVGTKIRRTSTVSPEQLVQNFLSRPTDLPFSIYSEKAKSEILDFVRMGDTNATSFIRNLVTHGATEKDVLSLLNDPNKFNLYRVIKSRLNKILQNTKFEGLTTREQISQNLSLLGTKDKTSFLNLTESKGFSEILEGKLSSEYIRGLKSTDKIGYNHFYDLFASIEKATDTRLSKIVGLDKEGVITLIKSMDKEICESPKVLEIYL